MSIEPGTGIPPMIGVVRGTPQRQQIETEFLGQLLERQVHAAALEVQQLLALALAIAATVPGLEWFTEPFALGFQQRALAAGILCFNIESAPELDRLHQCAPGDQAIEHDRVLNQVLRGGWAGPQHSCNPCQRLGVLGE